MLKRFQQFIAQEHLLAPGQRVLLAVSGGMDSVVMTTLFSHSEFEFGIAHCNFRLRGKESDADEQLVQQLAKTLQVPFLSKSFDLTEATNQPGTSVQMAARDARYAWLQDTRTEHNFDVIATAHHLDDSIETALHNYIRGTGFSGLRGVPARSNKIIRPVLFAHHHEIEAYAQEHKIVYRKDASNSSPAYTRNRIRNEILPILREINPGIEHSLSENLKHFKELEFIVKRELSRTKRRLLLKRHNEWFIPINLLRKLPYKRSALFEALREFGINITQVDEILTSLDKEPGKVWTSKSHRIIKDRRFLIVATNKQSEQTWLTIEKESSRVQANGIALSFSMPSAVGYELNTMKNVASIDMDKLTFPLTLRKWKQGDHFYPFGMKGKKKVSKFFKDEKMDLASKERTWILCSGERIVWVVGHRLDHRFRVTEGTRKVFRVEIIN